MIARMAGGPKSQGCVKSALPFRAWGGIERAGTGII
jgi:hypothetical protein